ncbi:DUF2938 domain-containing protein [Variovorax sp.]|uniref:DUF2938 domain-containing protein n=1 Tax=Variovorax sp. TaxID=1871043 RepID=UPI0013815458|nr:DUF2938 domain-containing protein [Variovorax sp.]KAF1069279.1 MAG: hypothetical protein GAK39_02776 [Variovorax sp.]
MAELAELLARAVPIGIGATVVMDLWAVVRRRVFGLPSLDYALVGRWAAHLPRGRLLGWALHYATGIAFALVLLGIGGLDWARRPTPGLALLVGIGTVAAPWLLMQPGMGAGLAARRTPRPWVARWHGLVTHAVFGLGLYLAACALSALSP